MLGALRIRSLPEQPRSGWQRSCPSFNPACKPASSTSTPANAPVPRCWILLPDFALVKEEASAGSRRARQSLLPPRAVAVRGRAAAGGQSAEGRRARGGHCRAASRRVSMPRREEEEEFLGRAGGGSHWS